MSRPPGWTRPSQVAAVGKSLRGGTDSEQVRCSTRTAPVRRERQRQHLGSLGGGHPRFDRLAADAAAGNVELVPTTGEFPCRVDAVDDASEHRVIPIHRVVVLVGKSSRSLS